MTKIYRWRSSLLIIACAALPAWAGSTRITVLDGVTRREVDTAEVRSSDDRLAMMNGAGEPVERQGGAFVAAHFSDRGTLYARVSAAGYSPVMLDYDAGAPPAVRVTLRPAVRLSGRVVSAGGGPLAGAALWMTALSGQDNAKFRGSVRNQAVRCDAEGRFSFDHAPDDVNNAWLIATHPDAAADVLNTAQPEGGLSLDALKDGSARVILTRGLRLQGIVTRADGTPIAGVRVSTYDLFLDGAVARRATTGPDGRWVLDHVAPPKSGLPGHLIYRAEGWGTTMRAIELDRDGDLAVVLDAPRTARIRVVDADDKPVESASVYVGAVNSPHLAPPVRSDKAGVALVPGLSHELLTVSGSRAGYQHASAPMTAGSVDADITLRLSAVQPPVRVHGVVVDDTTGNPIRSFLAVPGAVTAIHYPNLFHRPDAEFGADGAFDVPLSRWLSDPPSVSVRIEADGYEPSMAGPFPADPGNANRVYNAGTIRLVRATGQIEGVVSDRDGQPVAGAVVRIGTRDMPVQIMGDGTRFTPTELGTTTGADGRFTLPSQGRLPFTLVATSTAGLGSIDSTPVKDNLYRIPLEAWGALQGRFFDRGRAGRGVNVFASVNYAVNDPSAVQYSSHGTTADDGSFSMPRLAPGKYSVSFSLPRPSNRPMPNVDVVVKTGETTRVEVGTEGRPVVGRLVAPAGEAGAVASWFAYIDRAGPPVGLPDRVNDDPQVMRDFWMRLQGDDVEFAAWRDAARAQASVPQAFLEVAPDGSFDAGLLPAGLYSLRADAFAAPPDDIHRQGARLAEAQMVFVVESTGDAADDADDPVDLGQISARAVAGVRHGQPAPPVVGKLITGEPFDLAALKGKIVVLDFWATWCGPCVAVMPEVADLYEKFAKGNDADVVILGMCLDETPAPAVKYMTDNGYAWPSVFLGPWGATPVPDAYGVRGIPSIIVLDRNEKVVGIDLRPSQVKQLIPRLRQR